jgi:chemotaxis protein CheD
LQKVIPEIENCDEAQFRHVHVVQGDYEATSDPGIVLTTILGSCVCTCLTDPVARVGGMNHFLLPDGEDLSFGKMRYGLHAMELLINELLKIGAKRHRLEAKLFGGAGMQGGLGKIGQSNGEFALKFLETESIMLIGRSLGGSQARRVRYWPTIGKAQQLFIAQEISDDVVASIPRRGQATQADKRNPQDGVTYFD